MNKIEKKKKKKKSKESIGGGKRKSPREMADDARKRLDEDKSISDVKRAKIEQQIEFFEACLPPEGADLSKYPRPMDEDEFEDLARKLENAHTVFYTMWQLGRPIFDARIPTACVKFNPKDGSALEYCFNPFFWANINDEERRFVIAHECAHVFLNHGVRSMDSENHSASNVAQDIVINHMLVDRFGINRDAMRFADVYCWVDTIFKDDDGNPIKNPLTGKEVIVKEGMNFEHYYNIMKQLYEDSVEAGEGDSEEGEGDSEEGDGNEGKSKGQFGHGSGGQVLVDDHQGFGGKEAYGTLDGDSKSEEEVDGNEEDQSSPVEESEDPLKGAGQIIDDLNDLMTDEQKESLEQLIKEHFEHMEKNERDDSKDGDPDVQASNKPGAGRGVGKGNGVWTFKEKKKIKTKKKFITLVRKWVNRNRHLFADNEQWARIQRRMSGMDQLAGVGSNQAASESGMFLPSEYEDPDASEKKKIEVWLFLDTSGSCVQFAKRFWEFAESIPKDYFEIRPYCFDYGTYKVNFKDKKLFGFGGTAFQPIEDIICQETVNKGLRYPEIVFVVTDGAGSVVSPRHPERWIWFLTEGNYKEYIPKTSQTFNVNDFEVDEKAKRACASVKTS